MSKHIIALDGFRGLAALSVVAGHLTDQTIFGDWPQRSFLAVDFFFVLSGFVITSAYDKQLDTGMKNTEFFKIRLIRLYPLIALGMCLGLTTKLIAFHLHGAGGGRLHSYHDIFIAFLLGLFLIPSLSGSGEIFPLDTPAWSLMFELLANFFYIFVRKWVLYQRILLITLSVAGLALVDHFDNGINGGFDVSNMGIGFLRVGYSFFFGLLIFKVYASDFINKIPRLPFWILACLLLVTFIVPKRIIGGDYEVFVVLFVYPALVLFGAKCVLSERVSSLAKFAGQVSYPIYILHFPIVAHFSYFKFKSEIILSIAVFTSLVSMTIIAWAASKFFDEPVRHALNRVFNLRIVRKEAEILSGR